MDEPVPEDKWMKGYEKAELLYVNYQYHKDICAKSVERYYKIQSLQERLAVEIKTSRKLAGSEYDLIEQNKKLVKQLSHFGNQVYSPDHKEWLDWKNIDGDLLAGEGNLVICSFRLKEVNF